MLANSRKRPREVARRKQKMAASMDGKTICAFLLTNSTFFNAELDEIDLAQMKSQHSVFHAGIIANEKASLYGLSFDNPPCVKEVIMGGIANFPVGTLVQYETEPAAEQPQPQAQAAQSQPQVQPQGQQAPQQAAADNDEDYEGTSWTAKATRLLIVSYNEHHKDPDLKNKKRAKLWQRLSAALATHGYTYSQDQVSAKWRSLTYRHKTIRDAKAKSGAGKRKPWEFYELMDEVLAGDPAIEPGITVSSMSGVQHAAKKPAIASNANSSGMKRPATATVTSGSYAKRPMESSTSSESPSSPEPLCPTPPSSSSSSSPVPFPVSARGTRGRGGRQQPRQLLAKYTHESIEVMREIRDIGRERNDLFRGLADSITTLLSKENDSSK